MGAYLNGINQPFRGTLGGDVIPGFSFIPGQVHKAIITADPNGVFFVARGHDVENGIVIFSANRFVGDRAATPTLPRFVIPCQVGADFFPCYAAIFRANNFFRAVINDLGIVRVSRQRRIPIGTIVDILCCTAEDIFRIRFDRACAFVQGIKFGERTIDGGRINQPRVVLIKGNMGTFAAANSKEIFGPNTSLMGFRKNSNCAVILLAPIDAVRHLIIRCYSVKLCGWLV